MKKIILGLTLLGLMVVPVLAFAYPQGSISSIDQLVSAIKEPLWVIFGLIALVAFVFAGILFLTSNGEPEKITKARTAFLWGIVGIVVGIMAYSIVTIIETAL